MTKLDGVHPRLRTAIETLLDVMARLGHPMLVTDGVRSVAQQEALYAQGRTTPGRVVTWADGRRKRSNHQTHEDGLGHAVDCTFLHQDAQGVSRPCWCEKHPWLLYGEAAKALGLAWGGDWKTPKTDRPHVELKA